GLVGIRGERANQPEFRQVGKVRPVLLVFEKNKSRPAEAFMLYKIARFLQLAGLIIVPIGIAGNLAERNDKPVLDLKESLLLSTIGCLVFFCGWLLQQSIRPK